MDEERCEFTDLLISGCAHCRPNPELERVADRLNRPLGPYGKNPRTGPDAASGSPGLPFAHWAEDEFESEMRDKCVSCGGLIERGDRVRLALRYNTGVIHAECP